MSFFLGFMNENQDLILSGLMILVVFLIIWNAYLQFSLSGIKRVEKALFSGKKGADLEEVILGQIDKCKALDEAIAGLKDTDQRIINALSYAVQKVGVVRFNPFGEVGSNQSFALALLDNYNSGVIILSLYSRDGVRIYAKPVKEGKSEYQLSKEEDEVLRIAMKR